MIFDPTGCDAIHPTPTRPEARQGVSRSLRILATASWSHPESIGALKPTPGRPGAK